MSKGKLNSSTPSISNLNFNKNKSNIKNYKDKARNPSSIHAELITKKIKKMLKANSNAETAQHSLNEIKVNEDAQIYKKSSQLLKKYNSNIRNSFTNKNGFEIYTTPVSYCEKYLKISDYIK